MRLQAQLEFFESTQQILYFFFFSNQYLLFGWVLFTPLCFCYFDRFSTVTFGKTISLSLKSKHSLEIKNPWTHKSIHISYWQTASKNVSSFFFCQIQIDFRVSVNERKILRFSEFHSYLYDVLTHVILYDLLNGSMYYVCVLMHTVRKHVPYSVCINENTQCVVRT